ncbi:MAG: tetratricopeptide repeat protein [Arcobacteraceae bacterium]|jgi:TPR repeat protein
MSLKILLIIAISNVMLFGSNYKSSPEIQNGIEAVKKKDFDKAAEIFTKECEKGEGMICFALGFAYENGKGVKQDNEKAKDFYSKACQFKYDNGCLKSTMMISN